MDGIEKIDWINFSQALLFARARRVNPRDGMNKTAMDGEPLRSNKTKDQDKRTTNFISIARISTLTLSTVQNQSSESSK